MKMEPCQVLDKIKGKRMERKRETKIKTNKWNTVTNMVDIKPTISIATLNGNRLTASITRQTARINFKKRFKNYLILSNLL